MNKVVKIIGAGLAGCEAAWQLAKRNKKVELYEMKDEKFSDAHKLSTFAELVCSNSFKSDNLEFATGLLKAEMRELDSLIIRCADQTRISEDSSTLSVDRVEFSKKVSEKIQKEPNIKIIRGEVTQFDLKEPTIIAAGPLCSDALSEFLSKIIGEPLYFYDAIAPIVTADSIDYSKTFPQMENGKVNNEYLNCALTRDEYYNFVSALANAQRVELHSFEKEINFEACLPIEVMAKRGLDVLKCGPLKSNKTFAAVQLRKENTLGESYNLVGFQTNLTFGAQKEVFGMIPALKNVEFVRYGVMHRNTYINAPKFLNSYFQLKAFPDIFFAGQISGVEGYVESAASGLLSALNMIKYLDKLNFLNFGVETCLGALGNYLISASEHNFQPMHINYSLLKPIDAPKNLKRKLIAERALEKIKIIKESI